MTGRYAMRVAIVFGAFAWCILAVSGCGGGEEGSDSSPCSVLSSTRKIAGGESCDDGEPNVALLLVTSSAGTAECSGAYISLTSVLTAAHCFDGQPKEASIASKGFLRSGVTYYKHPLYDGRIGSPFDLAIVKVDRPISAAPLPMLISATPTGGEEVVAYGYGNDQNGREALARIQAGEAPLKATYAEYGTYQNGVVTIVSTGEGSQCPGDSGGPVVAKSPKGGYGIIGLTSAGPAGCSADAGRTVGLASTQSNGAIAFISKHVPDVAVN
jgi:hypothetical protein